MVAEGISFSLLRLLRPLDLDRCGPPNESKPARPAPRACLITELPPLLGSCDRDSRDSNRRPGCEASDYGIRQLSPVDGRGKAPANTRCRGAAGITSLIAAA